jgi:hypothetical protein
MDSSFLSQQEVVPMETLGQDEGFRRYSLPSVGDFVCEAPSSALQKPRLLDQVREPAAREAWSCLGR